MTDQLLTEHHLEFLSLNGGCTGSSESALVKIPHFWKSHIAAHIYLKMLESSSVLLTESKTIRDPSSELFGSAIISL